MFFLGDVKRNWEVSEGPEEPSVAGKIHEKGAFWHNTLKASKFVLDIVDNGLLCLSLSHAPLSPRKITRPAETTDLLLRRPLKS